MNCIICKSTNVKKIGKYESTVVSQEFHLIYCIDCKSRFFDVAETLKLSELYDEQAHNNKLVYSEVFKESRYWKREVEIIRSLNPASTICSVLDIGCRTGDFLMHWPSTIQRVGVEFSTVSASIAKKRGLDIVNTEMEKHKFNSKFDLISCYAVIEHLRNPVAFIQNLGNLINEHGKLVILIPTWQSTKSYLLEKLKLRWHMYSPPLHINFFSREKLDEVLFDCGFELVNRRFTSGGLFNPFQGIPLARNIFSRAMWIMDAYSPVNHFPIFDHMYSYYKFLK